MPGNLFTAVTIRRRSAAHGCANAHPDARGAVRGTVGTIKSPSSSGKIRGVTGDCGADKSVQNILTHTFSTPGNSPVICR